MGQGTGLRREIRPEGKSGSGGRGEKTLGVVSSWAWQGLFLTDATLALELILWKKAKEGRRGHIQRAFSSWNSLHSYKMLPLGLSP